MLLHSFKNKILLGTLILVFNSCHISVAGTVETQISQNRVRLGDSFVVTYIVNHNLNNSPDFSPLEKNFRILNKHYGNAVSMVNGVTAIQSYWRFQLEPKSAGELTIPEINFGIDQSKSTKLWVKAAVANQNDPSSNTDSKEAASVFVRGDINRNLAYVQGQLLYTFKLYFRNQLRNPRIEMPPINDVTIMQLSDRPVYQTIIQDNLYNVVEKTFAIFPKKSGELTIPSIQFHGYSIDDHMNSFDYPFNFDEPKAFSVATKKISLAVRDVPSDYQVTPWLPAKNISLTEQWSDNKTLWEAGVPITRTITLKAEGLRADQLPDFVVDQINGVNVYADRPKRSNDIQSDGVIGVLEQKITYIPNTTNAFSIPAIKINWWNTEKDSKSVTQLPEINVKVKDVVGLPKASGDALLSKNSPIDHAPSTTTHSTKILHEKFYTSIWFWVACLLLLAWLITLWTLRRKKNIKPNKKTIQLQNPVELNDKHFEEFCRTGQAIKAQQYLLDWAKKQWPDAVSNLASLRARVHDEPFQLAIQKLEHALYARNSSAWEGQALFSFYKNIKKNRKLFDAANKSVPSMIDPLPPLNPGND